MSRYFSIFKSYISIKLHNILSKNELVYVGMQIKYDNINAKIIIRWTNFRFLISGSSCEPVVG